MKCWNTSSGKSETANVGPTGLVKGVMVIGETVRPRLLGVGEEELVDTVRPQLLGVGEEELELKRKAKTEKIAEKFVKERSGRIQAEKSLELWKDKAILYRRYVQYITQHSLFAQLLQEVE